MSVTCVLYAAKRAEIDDLLRSPEGIHDFLSRANPVEQPGFFATLFGARPKFLPSPIATYDLGKSWEAVHYVLNGTRSEVPFPAGFIISGGEYVGDDDVGYGPARALTPMQVKAVAEFLAQYEPLQFRQRIDTKAMRPLHIYGAPLTDAPEDTDFLVSDYDGLRTFIVARAGAGEGVIVQYV